MPDLLEGHEASTIDLPPDDDGDLAATLVRRPFTSDAVVVYVHGYSDYYFQSHLAEAVEASGHDFMAVDLRRYGRSRRPGNRPNYIESLDHYWPELDALITAARADHDHVVMMGHSTGGLIASLYAHRGPLRDELDGLVLTSPWLDVKLPLVQRIMWMLARHLGGLRPTTEIAPGPSTYVDSIHHSRKGEWDFELDWKPPDGEPLHIGWTRAIALGHAEVHRGLDIEIPILVQHSDRSTGNDEWHDDMLRTDSVLDVDQIHRRSPLLGGDITIETIDGAMHDVWLSAADVRAEVEQRTRDWLTRLRQP